MENENENAIKELKKRNSQLQEMMIVYQRNIGSCKAQIHNNKKEITRLEGKS